MIRHVELTEQVKKHLRKVPQHVAGKLLLWVRYVRASGLEEVRKIPGFHDEPLKGQRAGQRSIRLSKAYRAIYVIKEREVSFVSVEEVSKHEY